MCTKKFSYVYTVHILKSWCTLFILVHIDTQMCTTWQHCDDDYENNPFFFLNQYYRFYLVGPLLKKFSFEKNCN